MTAAPVANSRAVFDQMVEDGGDSVVSGAVFTHVVEDERDSVVSDTVFNHVVEGGAPPSSVRPGVRLADSGGVDPHW